MRYHSQMSTMADPGSLKDYDLAKIPAARKSKVLQSTTDRLAALSIPVIARNLHLAMGVGTGSPIIMGTHGEFWRKHETTQATV
jgi:hypothetical protein